MPGPYLTERPNLMGHYGAAKPNSNSTLRPDLIKQYCTGRYNVIPLNLIQRRDKKRRFDLIGLSLPATGAPFGWSVATGELISAFQDLTDTYIITDACPKSIHGIPVLHAVAGVNMLPLRPQFWSAVRNIGYCFCEDNLTLKKYLRAARAFDAIVCGSTWGTEVFRSYGFESISVAIQGVAPEFFEVPPRQDVGQFVVFSGGKAEYRKGQDVAVKAMKIF